MILNSTQRQLLDRVQHDKSRRSMFLLLAEQDLKTAIRYLEITYGEVNVPQVKKGKAKPNTK